CFAEGISKALVARFVGAADALASERAYTRTTLPRGVARGVADTLLHGDSKGLARAGAIIAGFVVTAAGYLTGISGAATTSSGIDGFTKASTAEPSTQAETT